MASTKLVPTARGLDAFPPAPTGGSTSRGLEDFPPAPTVSNTPRGLDAFPPAPQPSRIQRAGQWALKNLIVEPAKDVGVFAKSEIRGMPYGGPYIGGMFDRMSQPPEEQARIMRGMVTAGSIPAMELGGGLAARAVGGALEGAAPAMQALGRWAAFNIGATTGLTATELAGGQRPTGKSIGLKLLAGGALGALHLPSALSPETRDLAAEGAAQLARPEVPGQPLIFDVASKKWVPPTDVLPAQAVIPIQPQQPTPVAVAARSQQSKMFALFKKTNMLSDKAGQLAFIRRVLGRDDIISRKVGNLSAIDFMKVNDELQARIAEMQAQTGEEAIGDPALNAALEQRRAFKARGSLNDELSLHPDIVQGGPEARLRAVNFALGRDPELGSKSPVTAFAELDAPTAQTAQEALRARRLGFHSAVTPDDTPWGTIRWAKNQMDRFINSGVGKMLFDDFGAIQDIYERGIRSAGVALKDFGPAGKELGERLYGADMRATQHASTRIVELEKQLAGLTDAEATNLADVLEAKAQPMSEPVAKAAATFRPMAEEASNAAKDSGMYMLRKVELKPGTLPEEYAKRIGGEVYSKGQGHFVTFKVPYAGITNWYPHIYTEKSIAELTLPQRAEILNAVREDLGNKAATWEDALKVLRRQRREKTPEFLNSNLQHSRTLLDLPGYERDARLVLKGTLLNEWRRIEYAREFGPNHEVANDLIKEISKTSSPDNATQAQRVYNAMVGFRPWMSSTNFQEFANIYKGMSAIQLLSPTAALKHVGQIFNTAARTGMGTTARAWWTMLRDAGMRDEARRAGMALRDLLPDIAGDELRGASKWWTNSPFTGFLGQTVRGNRLTAAIAGRFHAQNLAEAFGKEPTSRLAYELQRLGIAPDEVLQQGGKLNEDQLHRAMYNVANQTQLMSGVLDTPMWRQSKYGQLTYLFNSMAMQQTEFLAREVLGPATLAVRTRGRLGSFGPLIRTSLLYGAGPGAAIGLAVKQVQDWKSGITHEPPHGAIGYLWYCAHSGFLGKIMDVIEAAAKPNFSGVQDLEGEVVGVLPSDILGMAMVLKPLAYAMGLSEETPKEIGGGLTKALVSRQVPGGLGRRVANLYVGPPKPTSWWAERKKANE